MRIIAVERIDRTYGRNTYDTYEFSDNITDDEITTNEDLLNAFEDFVNVIPTSVCRADGHTVDEYLDACEWWFYDITDKTEGEK